MQLIVIGGAIEIVSGCAVYIAADGSAGGKPSPARATGHAALDVATLGLWEIVGTPAELIIQKNQPKPEPQHIAIQNPDGSTQFVFE